MAHINYSCLRGRVHAFAPAPGANPHLWVLLEADRRLWFATINVRSDKGAPGDPIEKSYLYYLIDGDFRHPVIPSILGRPQGLSAVNRDYGSGALDFQRGNLFDPRAMRVLPMEGQGGDNLEHRLTGILQVARNLGSDVFFYGNAFAKDNRHQTDAAFGFTPDTPFGLDNIHMAQGDPRAIDAHLHENGIWHDGACFVWDPHSQRMTAAFLAFQTQAWHTNDNGDLLYGVTGCEAPLYDFSDGIGAPKPPANRAAELTSLHRPPKGAGAVVVANMTSGPLDLSGWTILAQMRLSVPLPGQALAPAQPLAVALPTEALSDAGGILTLLNPSGLRVDGVAYRGGDPATGWSTTF